MIKPLKNKIYTIALDKYTFRSNIYIYLKLFLINRNVIKKSINLNFCC